jgi:sigma-B regulation protein RsbU (phosphoserine phosphatase)
MPDGRYVCALGDAAGKGIGAALVMAETLAALRALAASTATPLQLVLRLREILSERLANQMFVTLFLACIEPSTGRIDYVNAGHEPAALLTPGAALRWLDSTGLPLGMPVPLPLEQGRAEFAPGALLAVWSDGVTEAMQPGSNPPRMFGRERVQRWLERHRGASPAAVVDGVFTEVERFLGRAHAQDDRTMLVLRRCGASPHLPSALVEPAVDA